MTSPPTSTGSSAAPGGWPLVGWATVAVLAIQALVFAVAGTGEEGVRMAIRATARSSIILFGLAFIASSLVHLWPSPFSRWVRANRRYLGVSFAVSHFIHLLDIFALVFGFNVETNALTLAVGGLGYVMIAAMTATSFDRTAAWLGRPAWSRLHGFGARYIWFVFFVTLAPSPGKTNAIRLLMFGWLLATAGIRTAAALKSRRLMTPSTAP